ncbi:MAG: MoaD/ThiS family protein [Saccharospirillum sp.]|nr:MoaD/ThiS family protein [Saccharospirillum sp.]
MPALQCLKALRKGLPQENAHDIVLRHGLEVSADCLCFGSTTGNAYVSEDAATLGTVWAIISRPFIPSASGDPMPTVKMTSQLYRFFPQLQNQNIEVPAGSVAEALHSINDLAPGFTDYIIDERGALRRHVKVCINDTIIIDRKALSDRLKENDTLFVFQALTGGEPSHPMAHKNS